MGVTPLAVEQQGHVQLVLGDPAPLPQPVQLPRGQRDMRLHDDETVRRVAAQRAQFGRGERCPRRLSGAGPDEGRPDPVQQPRAVLLRLGEGQGQHAQIVVAHRVDHGHPSPRSEDSSRAVCAGPPPRRSSRVTRRTSSAGMRPPVFSSTHSGSDELR
nr:hypothetical protein [Streptomyces cavernae]